jgi:hypothetical protein
MTQVRLKCKICGKEETIQICTRSLEIRDLRKVRLIPSYPTILSNRVHSGF